MILTGKLRLVNILKSQDVKEIEEERDTLIKFLTSKDDEIDNLNTL